MARACSPLIFDSPSLHRSGASGRLSESETVIALSAVSDTSKLSECARTFVYYRVISKNGSRQCKQPADERDPFLGRLEVEHLTSPLTAGAVIQCICGIEGVATHHDTKLFSSASNTCPMDREEHVEILSSAGPGSDPFVPLVLVLVDQSDPHNKLVIAKYSSYWAYGEGNSKWMSFKKGEILFTDGIVRSSNDNGAEFGSGAYRVQKSNGEIGFVCVCDFSGPS